MAKKRSIALSSMQTTNQEQNRERIRVTTLLSTRVRSIQLEK